MPHACNNHFCMSKLIQIRHVPERVHRTLKARAARAGMSLSDYLLSELADLASRPTPEEMRERLESRSRVLEGESSVAAVRASRSER